MRQSNSTIRVNKKNLECGHFDYDFSRGRCRDCARVQDTLSKDSKLNNPVEDMSGLIQDADNLISRYVRLLAADENGLVKCFTCPTILPWTQMQAGHYVPRANLFLRHDMRNVKPQCYECNCVKHGRLAVYSVKLGETMVEQLINESRIVYSVTREELRTIIADTTIKLSKIKLTDVFLGS